MQDNFGYSLMASYCEQFVFEFVLHGTSDRSFLNDLNQMLIFSKKVDEYKIKHFFINIINFNYNF